MADGLHIGQDDGDPALARRLLGPNPVIGLSVTKAVELATVDASVVDYVGLGPVFATASKTDAAAALGLEETARIGRTLPVPYVAIGGINASTASVLLRVGAAGVAVVSAICAATDPRAAARLLRSAIDGANA
jgi:thiamine-phosphate pyrophosphorylase